MSLKSVGTALADNEQLAFRVEGMDCASCVGKIETALSRLNGVSDISVQFTSETLSVSRSLSGKTTARDIVKKIRNLGFDATALPASADSTESAFANAAQSNGKQAHRRNAHKHGGLQCSEAHDHESFGNDDGGDHKDQQGHACNDHQHQSQVHDRDHSHESCKSHASTSKKPSEHASVGPNLTMRVEGMDCASCVGKIETALSRMPGVSDVQINFNAETLGLSLASGAFTQVSDIEKTIKNLGFGVSGAQYDSTRTDAPRNVEAPSRTQRWWQTKKGKLVISLGILMSIAYAVAHLIPEYAGRIFTAAVIVGVLPFARKALALATSGSPFSIEMLMVVASLGALMIGQSEESAAVVFLFAIGELLESVAAGRARAGIKALANLVPKTAVLLDQHGRQRTVPAASLSVGDSVLVRPGDRVPADGVILHGASSLDESPVTGESVPRPKTSGESIFAGSINVEGALQVRVEKAAADNTISRIIQLVEQAQSAKAPTARFIEKLSRYYTPAVMGIAALIIVLPPLAFGGIWETWLYRGLSLLLIACPCALVLSTPAAIASGLAVATRRGLLIKGGNALETIGRVGAVAFDKTGTLTEGKPRVTDVVSLCPGGENDVLALAAAVESGSNHPLAKAIVAHAEDADIVIPSAQNASATPGKAVHATVNGRNLTVGSPSHAAKAAKLAPDLRQRIEALEDGGKTVSVLFDEQDREIIGLLALRDEPRSDAREGVARLKQLGIRSVMLTGDNSRTAHAIASQLGIEWQAELLPQDKLRHIDKMKRDVKVAMVGDGINDAPALATADVGIAMAGGTDVAIETADAALLKSRVTDVAHLVAISRATMANIQQNVTFALGLKVLFLITTVLGVTGLWVAVMADTGATALVTLNALRLLRFGKTRNASSGRDGGMTPRPATSMG
ncbi:Heavy metal translocating P-type ATPase [Paraburkholderia piptadeniae]|uniref:P-type Zn(2+) transporter n=2 Tax=Paraburkholderia TaxID=1822464 RepID=A0A7X1TIP6_9BURK|nr:MULTISPECIES: heavy metal translocating P-type ATPase [Paraburkholderia]MPW20444.1 cadmium-translocating P-type ATPase [Paraburkholderia franconis]SIT50906.1 Heavy metal translocating P-type ATPase [Paraburkholderia piptadeniae]